MMKIKTGNNNNKIRIRHFKRKKGNKKTAKDNKKKTEKKKMKMKKNKKKKEKKERKKERRGSLIVGSSSQQSMTSAQECKNATFSENTYQTPDKHLLNVYQASIAYLAIMLSILSRYFI